MDKKILIVGRRLHCKKGGYNIRNINNIEELIDSVIDFCERPSSTKYIQMEVSETGVKILFNPKDMISKDFGQDEKSLKVLEKHNQTLLEIEKLD